MPEPRASRKELVEGLLRQATIYRRFSKAMAIGSLLDDEEVLEQAREALFAARLYSGPRVLDVGAGAGYPTVPVGMLRPDLEIVLVERREKAASYLEYLLANLGLSRMRVVRGSLGDSVGKIPLDETLGLFDTIVFRAVPGLTRLCRSATSMLTCRGSLLLFLGRSRKREVSTELSALGFRVAARDETWTDNKVILIAKS